MLKFIACLACLLGFDASASVVCSSTLVMEPPLPTRIVIPPGAAVGTLLFQATLTSTHNCSGTETSSLGSIHTLVNGGLGAVAMSSNAALGLQSATGGSVVWSGGCPSLARVTTFTSTRQLMGVRWVAGDSFASCVVSVRLPLQLVVMQVPVSAANVTGSSVVVGQCANGNPWGCTNLSTDGVTAGVIDIGSATPIPVIVIGGCTLAATSYSVNLPTVSADALNRSGRTAGQTPFSLLFAGCTTETSYSVSARWEFIEDHGSTIIANTAVNGAPNAAIQILDANQMPVVNGQRSLLQSTAAAGPRSVQYYARYYAIGPVSAGLVQSSATFVLEYQ